MQSGTESKEYQTEIIILKREVVEIGRAKRGKMNPTEGGGGGEREWGERVGKRKGGVEERIGRERRVYRRERRVERKEVWKREGSGRERGIEERG